VFESFFLKWMKVEMIFCKCFVLAKFELGFLVTKWQPLDCTEKDFMLWCVFR